MTRLPIVKNPNLHQLTSSSMSESTAVLSQSQLHVTDEFITMKSNVGSLTGISIEVELNQSARTACLLNV